MSSTEDGPGKNASKSPLNEPDLNKQYDQNKNREISGNEGSFNLQERCQSDDLMNLVDNDGIANLGKTQDEDKIENVSLQFL